ncbi:MAG: carbon-nitrogen hydrolase family protein [Spirochaetes bacterium]|nr:carbon-nitrogen hydrolase family protein [Spirochaetota bacterium]
MEQRFFKLAGIQMQTRVGDIAWNLEHSIELVQEAARQGADLACFPESVLDGYASKLPELPRLRRPVTSHETERMAAVARQAGMWVMWTLAETVGNGTANTALLLDREGKLRLHYRKSHLCTEEGEHLVYQAGDVLPVVDLEQGIRTGAMICFDRHFPEVARTLRLHGANLILHPTATDWFTPNPDHINHAMMRTRAYENRCFVFSVNQANYGGGSALYGPWGEVLAIAGRCEGILYAEIDLQRIALQPENTFELLQFRRPELYKGWATG